MGTRERGVGPIGTPQTLEKIEENISRQWRSVFRKFFVGTPNSGAHPFVSTGSAKTLQERKKFMT